MKKNQKILVIILAVAVGVVLLKNVLIKSAVETTVGAVTGFPLKIKSLKVGIFDTYVSIKDLKMHNPENFEEPILMHIPEVHLDYSLMPIFKGKVHVKDMRFHLSEMNVVTNKDGELNLDKLKELVPESDGEKAEKEDKPKKKKAKHDIAIDHLALQVDKVVIKDYSKGGEPKISEKPINLKYEASDIKSIEALVATIFFKTVMTAGISNLLNFDVAGLGSAMTGTILAGAETATKAAGKAKDAAGKVVGEAGDTLKDATEGIKNVLPFGKKDE